MMKKLKFYIAVLIVGLSFNACQQDDDLEFVALPAGDFAFNTTFLDNYILNPSMADNLAERFTWSTVSFSVPTNVTYNLQGATEADFSDFIPNDPLYELGNSSGNELAVTVKKMIALAEAAGLDNDPNSAAPNTGTLYFRLMAVVGDSGLPTYSNIQPLNVEYQEVSNTGGGATISTWGIVGSGYNDWGNGGPDGQFFSTGSADVFVAYVSLLDGEIKFREDNDWANDFGDDGADGTLEKGGANIPVTAGDYKITLNLKDNTYTMEEFSWGIVGSGYNDWGNAGPDAKFYYDYTTDTFKVGVTLLDGEIKFRQNNKWEQDFGDTGMDGTIEPGGDNLQVTAGTYAITLDFNTNTYTMVPTDIWGIIGSGYNDWGNAGPDFSLTEIQPNIWIGDIATFIDGEIKFRQNNAGNDDFGDDGADGTLEKGGANIPVTAGKYRVRMNLDDNTYQLNKIQ